LRSARPWPILACGRDRPALHKKAGVDVLQRIEQVAEFTVARGCGFALLSIFTLMIGLSGTPGVSLQVGGIGSLLVCFVLLLKAGWATRKPYRATELWLLLEPEDRPHETVAQTIVAGVLRAVYLRFAVYFAMGAAALFATLVLLNALAWIRA
jgi:hypothetical protein